MKTENIGLIFDVAEMVTYVLRADGCGQDAVEIGLYLAGEMLAQGETNPVAIIHEVKRRIDHEWEVLYDEAQVRKTTTRVVTTSSRKTGTKPQDPVERARRIGQ